jgi:dUTPase
MATPSLSLLSGEEIKSLALVQGSTNDDLYRASTYDLSIGEIIPAKSAATGSSYKLPAGGTVRVVSKEFVKLPNDVTGHALLKNELCRKGVLAINIGVIDPGFEGPLSSILINFGKEDFMVQAGAPFLRISFLRCPVSPKADGSKKYKNKEEYVSGTRDEVMAYMAPTFLNMDATAERAAERVIEKFKNNLVIWATIVGILLAALAIFAPLGASLVDRYLIGRDQKQAEMEQIVEQKMEERYEGRLNALSEEVEQLKRGQRIERGQGTGKH